MIRGWLARLRSKRELDAEMRRRLDDAIDRTRQETDRLVQDGAELAERIRRNAAKGRNLIGGDRPL